jgi:DNA-binding transcriptional MerR regulator
LRSYRVDELAETAGVSVEVLRSYQSKGLLPPPRHQGRVALYDNHHLERLRAIRDLKARGFPLKVIARMLDRRVAAERSVPFLDVAGSDDELLTQREVAERSGVHPAMLRSLEASGVIRPRLIGGEPRYTIADVRAMRMLLSLLGGGLPIEEFMRVADRQLDAVAEVASGAVDLFMRYVRAPLLTAGLSQREEAERVIAAFRLMVHAATSLLAYNFERMLVNAAQEAIERDGSRAERAALRREAGRRHDVALPA